MDNTFWQMIIEADYAIPTEYTVAALTPELLSNLGSTDAYLRDEAAYLILGNWIERGHYAPTDLRTIGAQMLHNFTVGLGEQGTDTVFLRSFSALILECIVEYDNAHPFLEEQEIHNWLDATLHYFEHEQDVRGHVSIKGWAHSVAHTADMLMILAKNRHVGRAEFERILNAVSDKVTRPIAHIYIYIEDERMAYATLCTVQRDILDMTFLSAWLANIVRQAYITASEKGALFTDEPAASAYFNARAFLRSLYFQLLFTRKPPALASELKSAIEQTLKDMDLGFYQYQ